MILRIMTSDPDFVQELVEASDPASGEIRLEDACSIRPVVPYQPHYDMVGGPEILQFVITAATDVAIGVLSSWIYDRLKERKMRAEIGGKELPCSEEEIKAILILVRKQEKGKHT